MKLCPGLALVAVLLSSTAVTHAQSLPAYMAPISGQTSATPADIATKDVLALNTGMFELYGDAAKVFQKNILSKHPVILGLFSGAGGRFILYRPGMAPLEAPQVPIVYQLLKSVGHSTMALAEVVGPYLDNPDDKSWRGSMLAYRSRMQSALDGLDATPMPAGMARQQPHHPAEQHRLHGRVRGQGRDPVRRAGGVRQEAGALSRQERRLGGADPGRALDEVLADWKKHARRRLGQDLRGQQHDLCGAPEQRAVQRARAVLSARTRSTTGCC